MAPPTVTWRVPGRDHRPQPEREQGAHQLVEADAGLDPDPAPGQVDVEDPVEAGRDDHVAAGVLGGVAVTAAEAPGDDASRAGLLEGYGQIVRIPAVAEARQRRRGPAPSGDGPDLLRLAGHGASA